MPAHDLHDRFLTHLPGIEAHARADLEAETIAFAWKHLVDLVARGRNPDAFVTTLAMRCAQAARSGRRVAGGFKKREAMPQRGTAHQALTRIPLRDAEHMELRYLADALRADARTPVPQRVAFRIDFTSWRAALTAKRRAVLDALAAGRVTCEVAQAFDICPGRVSQMRRELADGWRAFRAV